eukprot:275414-Pelagomonas_calceolata.AAC.1
MGTREAPHLRPLPRCPWMQTGLPSTPSKSSSTHSNQHDSLTQIKGQTQTLIQGGPSPAPLASLPVDAEGPSQHTIEHTGAPDLASTPPHAALLLPPPPCKRDATAAAAAAAAAAADASVACPGPDGPPMVLVCLGSWCCCMWGGACGAKPLWGCGLEGGWGVKAGGS